MVRSGEAKPRRCHSCCCNWLGLAGHGDFLLVVFTVAQLLHAFCISRPPPHLDQPPGRSLISHPPVLFAPDRCLPHSLSSNHAASGLSLPLPALDSGGLAFDGECRREGRADREVMQRPLADSVRVEIGAQQLGGAVDGYSEFVQREGQTGAVRLNKGFFPCPAGEKGGRQCVGSQGAQSRYFVLRKKLGRDLARSEVRPDAFDVDTDVPAAGEGEQRQSAGMRSVEAQRGTFQRRLAEGVVTELDALRRYAFVTRDELAKDDTRGNVAG